MSHIFKTMNEPVWEILNSRLNTWHMADHKHVLDRYDPLSSSYSINNRAVRSEAFSLRIIAFRSDSRTRLFASET